MQDVSHDGNCYAIGDICNCIQMLARDTVGGVFKCAFRQRDPVKLISQIENILPQPDDTDP